MYILHLSDLHFGTEKDANKWYEQLATDLHKNLNCNSLDALIISGDIASISKLRQEKESEAKLREYKGAREFILNLMIDFRLQWSEVVIVPGNHDLNLEKSRKAYKSLEECDGTEDESHTLVKVKQEKEDYDYILDLDKYKQRFSEFRNFYRTVVKKPYPPEPDWQFTLHHFPNHNLLILGMNSAWQLDFFYRDRTSINREALNNAIAEINQNYTYKNSRLKIAVWHHPLNSPDKDPIRDHGFMEQLAQNGFRLALHGHIHQASKDDFNPPTEKQIDIIAAGTFGVSKQRWDRGYPSQYNLLKWERKKLTVYTRKRRTLEGTWQPDTMWGNSNEIARPHPSYYEIDLLTKDGRAKGFVKDHYQELSKPLIDGSVVPFLGADINLCGRPSEKKDFQPYNWVAHGPYPPTNLELAAYIDNELGSPGQEQCGYLETVRCPFLQGTSLDELPRKFPPECPLSTKCITWLDLQRVSQYVQSRQSDPNRLTGSINFVYNQSSYEFNKLHELLVHLIKSVCPVDPEKSGSTAYPLIVTTCFDRTLERALEKESLPFDLVSYTSSKKQFIHKRFDCQDGAEKMSWTKGEIISKTNKDMTFLEDRPVILRLYGPVKWNNSGENFAITEDHFLDYFACEIDHKLPTDLWNKLKDSHLWFLGYSLSYWNLRFIIRQIKAASGGSHAKWWVVQEKADILDRNLWNQDKDVIFFGAKEIVSFEEYLKKVEERLTDQLKELPKIPDKS